MAKVTEGELLQARRKLETKKMYLQRAKADVKMLAEEVAQMEEDYKLLENKYVFGKLVE